MSLERVKRAAVAAAAVLAFTAFGLGNAHAQAFNVNDFSCTSNGVHVDVSGLGHQDVCVIDTVDNSLNCACAGGGGNCTSDTKKQTTTSSSTSSTEVQTKNGRVNTTVPTATPTATDAQCASLSCPSGQTARLVSYSSTAEFTLCTSNGATPCGCQQQLAEPITCGPTTVTPYPGKKGSCAALFQ